MNPLHSRLSNAIESISMLWQAMASPRAIAKQVETYVETSTKIERNRETVLFLWGPPTGSPKIAMNPVQNTRHFTTTKPNV